MKVFAGEERFVEIPGFRIAVREWGPANGIPVLALHGWVDNAASFDFLAPLLPNCHVVAMDSPGCGHSSHRDAGAVTVYVDEVFHVLRVATALGWDKFVLLGHSRGAGLAQMTAAGCPQRIQALIGLDWVGFPHAEAGHLLDVFRHSLDAFLNTIPRPATLYKDLDTAVKGRLVAGPMEYRSALALTLRGAKPVEGGYKWTFDRRELHFVTPMPFMEEQQRLILAGIEAPTLILLGQDGLLSGKDMRVGFIESIPNHELHIIPGHHHFHMDSPETTALHILNFLARVLV